MGWDKTVRKEIKDIDLFQYACAGEGSETKVDCSLGSSPVGAPPEVSRKWHEGFTVDPSPYCNDFSPLTEGLRDFWGQVFENEEVVYGPGSIYILSWLAFITGGEGARILGVSPQFPDVPSYFRFNGAELKNIRLEGLEYALDVKNIVSGIEDDTTLVYLDHPNNPTGQYLHIEDLMELAELCEDKDILLVIDEAYGGFIPEEESSINLRYKNLVSVRSFSKAWGLAGIRAGYAVIRDKQLRDYYRKICPPFPFSVSMNELIPAVLTDRDYLSRLRKMILKIKERTLETIRSTPGFTVAKTSMTVPIMLVSYDDHRVNLFEHLLEYGIKTEPGPAFMGLGSNSVRLRVPSPDKIDLFNECWKEAAESLVS